MEDEDRVECTKFDFCVVGVFELKTGSISFSSTTSGDASDGCGVSNAKNSWDSVLFELRVTCVLFCVPLFCSGMTEAPVLEFNASILSRARC